jgi:hypothetical protein
MAPNSLVRSIIRCSIWSRASRLTTGPSRVRERKPQQGIGSESPAEGGVKLQVGGTSLLCRIQTGRHGLLPLHLREQPEDDRPRRLVLLAVDQQHEAMISASATLDALVKSTRTYSFLIESSDWRGPTQIGGKRLSNPAGKCWVAVEDPGIAIEMHGRGNVEDAPNHR